MDSLVVPALVMAGGSGATDRNGTPLMISRHLRMDSNLLELFL
jgi:hypothetical protein